MASSASMLPAAFGAVAERGFELVRCQREAHGFFAVTIEDGWQSTGAAELRSS